MSSTARFLGVVSGVCALLLLGLTAAGGAGGTLSGTITDPGGQPLAGAVVQVKSATARVDRSTTSGEDGRYEFTGLPPAADYVLSVSHPGGDLAPVTQDRIVVKTGATTEESIRLFKATQEKVIVRCIKDQGRVVMLEEVGQSTEFSAEYLEGLPLLGRNYQDLLTLAAGVVDADDGNPNVLGARTATFATNLNTDVIDGTGVSGAGFNTEAYRRIEESGFHPVALAPLSTFSIDVDTASYANVRRFLRQGMAPPADAVRIEELLNSFRFAYPEPAGEHPVSVQVEMGPCPWKPAHRLARIGLRAREVAARSRPPASLVFLLDVSGSMNEPNKLPLVKRSLRLLLGELGGGDLVTIVVYAGAAGLVLPPTPAPSRELILEVIANLEAGGSTAGGEGIRLAYDQARASYIPGGVNRVILATDGDFNVGVSSEGELSRLIEKQAVGGIFLTALGFGMGNYKDTTLETLADRGNGNYAYIDDLAEARKVLVEEAGSTLVTVARDVKVQVEFNPAQVAAYRLIGYENRLLAARDFTDDAKDAGEMGAGHTVTALYEIVPAGAPVPAPAMEDLRYQQPARLTEAAGHGEWLAVKVRYKEPEGGASRLLEVPAVAWLDEPEAMGEDFRFAAAVAAFGMLLRDSPHGGEITFDEVLTLAEAGLGPDPGGHRARFLEMVELAQALPRP